MSRLWGVTPDAIKEVIRAGRLPLIECETEGAEMLKKRGIDCLTIFLKPPSVDVFEVGATDKACWRCRASDKCLCGTADTNGT